MFKKSVTIIVAIILLSLVISPSINADISKISLNDNNIELEVELCGLGGKNNIQITQKQLEKIELLFDDLKVKLDKVESDEETLLVFYEAIDDLEKYGLLKAEDTKQVKRSLKDKYIKYDNEKIFERINENLMVGEYCNQFCLVAGESSHTSFFNLFAVSNYNMFKALNTILGLFFSFRPGILPDLFQDIVSGFVSFLGVPSLFFWILYTLGYFSSILIPFQLAGVISFGIDKYSWFGRYHDWYPSNGWLYSKGLNGIVKPTFPLYGKINTIYFPRGDSPDYTCYHTGIIGFTGIKINTIFNEGYYLGSALCMDVGYL